MTKPFDLQLYRFNDDSVGRFVIDGVTRRQIIEEIADHYGISLDYSDSRITREMCQELADELSVTEPEEREVRYQVLLGGIANASGIAWDTRQI